MQRSGTYRGGGSRLSRSISGMFGKRSGGNAPSSPHHHTAHYDMALATRHLEVTPEEPRLPFGIEPTPSDGRVIKKFVVKAGTYDGELKDGMRHGKGIYKWSSGQQYQGDWDHDIRCGQGTETWPDGRKYQGQWENDMFNGTGVWIWADGRVFQGNFINYCPVEGKLYMPDNSMFSVKYEGDQPVFDGSSPSPIALELVADQAVVEESYEKMYEELCHGTVFTTVMRENFFRQDANGVSMSTALRVDDVYMEHDEGEGPLVAAAQRGGNRSMEVRVSVDMRRSQDARRSQDVPRPRRSLENARADAVPRKSVEMQRIENNPSFDTSGFRQSIDYARKSMSRDIARSSQEVARRISQEISRITRPSAEMRDPARYGLLNENELDLQEDRPEMIPSQPALPAPVCV